MAAGAPCYTVGMARSAMARSGAEQTGWDRVVVQLLGPSTGGIRVHVAELARRLELRGWRVSVAGPAGVMDGVVGGRALDATVPVPSGWHPARLVAARRALATVVGAQGGDGPLVVHAHGLKAAAVALSLRVRRTRRRPPPVVLTIHNLVVGTHAGLRARAMRAVETAIIRRADHVLVISHEIAERVRDVVPARSWSFVLPVAPARLPTRGRDEVRASHGISPVAPLVVVVARLHPQKDLATFLRAMLRVHRTVTDVRAIIVGDGPERRALTEQRDELGLGGVVELVGHRPDPADEMHAADVVALSSRWEGSPLVVAEYLALGKPLATTAVGTVTEHLEDGVSARIVPVGDDAALAAALIDLLTDGAAAERIGQAGRRIGHDVFDAERLVDGVVRAYERVMP